MRKGLVILFSFLLQFLAGAQFKNVESLFTDSAFFPFLRAKKVRSVTESKKSENIVTVTAIYNADKQCRIVKMVHPQPGRTTKKSINTYDDKEHSLKMTFYDDYDTSRVLMWKKLYFDEKNRLVKQVHGEYNYRTWIEYKVLDFIYKEEKRLTSIEKRVYGREGQLGRTIYTRDSIAGVYTFTVQYEFSTTGYKEGVRFGDKMLLRQYTVGRITVEDQIKYTVSGRTEKPSNIESRYWITDSLGREVENGSIFYEALEFQLTPNQTPGYKMPQLFGDVVKAILNNKMPGEKRFKYRFIYDQAGHVSERLSENSSTIYKYNERGQIVQQINHWSNESIVDYTYDENGLLLKHVWTNITPRKNGRIDPPWEMSYTYTFY